ncbi:MAG: MATE family efflux transporter [Allosphingosinicella sp.]
MPITLQAVLSAAVLLIDIFFVARLGTAAVSAVGWTAALLGLFNVLVNGVGIAVTALVATALASDDPAAPRAAIGQALAATLLLSLLIPLLAWPCYEPFLRAFGAPTETIALGRPYAAWVIFGSPSLTALFVVNCILRGAGRPEIALRALIVACLASIVLNPVLIFGLGPVPAYGLAGAGAATVLGRLAGTFYQAATFLGPERARLGAVTLRDLWVPPAAFARLLSMSAGGTAQSVVMLLSALFILRFTAFYGEAAVAGYVIASRIVGFAVLPIHGIAASAMVLAGQSTGRRRRTETVVHLATAGSVAITLALTAIAIGLAETIVGWFAAGPEAVLHAERYLAIAAIFFAPYALASVLTHVVNGVGRLRDVAVAYALAYLAVQVPLAFALTGGLGLGAAGVWAAAGLAHLALALLAVPVARRHVSRRLLRPFALLRDLGLRRR